MSGRPVIKLPSSRLGSVLNGLSIALVIASWLIPILLYSSLPETIPSHFNFKGEVDGWGNRKIIFLLPVISVVIYTLITVVQCHPEIHNYTSNINESNAPENYSRSVNMLAWVKLICMLLFLIVEGISIQAAIGKLHISYLWIVWVLSGFLLLIPLISIFRKDPV
jgi:uncharacterized membrane protein